MLVHIILANCQFARKALPACIEQAMQISGDNRFSQIKTSLAAAHHFLLSQKAAAALIDRIETAIRENWERVCEEAELSPIDKNYLWGRQFLNPFSMER